MSLFSSPSHNYRELFLHMSITLDGYRTTTLSDIYRTLGMNRKSDEERKLQRKQDPFIDDAEDYKEEYEEGDVTGFMSQKPLTNSGINTYDVSSAFFAYSICESLKRKIKAKLC